MDGLDRLKRLNSELPDLSELVNIKEGNEISYAMEHKEDICEGVGLKNSGGVAVQDVYLSKDSVFPKHNHDETEFLILYTGSLEVEYWYDENNKSKTNLEAGGCIRFSPKMYHKVSTKEDSWLIGITIPASEGYPNARK